METIKLKRFSTKSEDAQILFNEIETLFSENKKVSLDFSDTILISNFASTLVWNLLENFEENYLKENLSFVNLNKTQVSLLDTCKKLAKDRLGLSVKTIEIENKEDLISRIKEKESVILNLDLDIIRFKDFLKEFSKEVNSYRFEKSPVILRYTEDSIEIESIYSLDPLKRKLKKDGLKISSVRELLDNEEVRQER